MEILAFRRCRPMSLALLPFLAAAAFLPALAAAQALPGLSSPRVAYNTRKATANPQGESKARLDAVDKELTAAMRAGNAGEARRQLAKGLGLLAGTAWTPALDYQSPLVIRSRRTIADSSAPYAARLEQIYRPALDLTAALTARVSGSRAMVAELKRLGAEVTYIEVSGGHHADVVVPNLPKVFEFLAAHRRPAPALTELAMRRMESAGFRLRGP
jgi:hypothetical protein